MNKIRSNFGFSTLLICFTMICIVIFSVLSVVTANSDYVLSRKVADKNITYYEAQNSAYEFLEETDRKLYKAYKESSSSQEYFAKAKEAIKEYTYSVELSDTQTLNIEIEILYPRKDDDHFYRVIRWQTVMDTSVDDEKTLDLLD